MGSGFFAGLIGGVGQQLQTYEDRNYQQKVQDRKLRLQMLQDQANAIGKRIQAAIDAGQKPSPADLAMSANIWKQVDDITGQGGGKGKNKGGLTLGTLGNLLTKIHLAGRMAQTSQPGSGGAMPPPEPMSGDAQSGGPAGGLRPDIPALPRLSSIPGAPGSRRSDPFSGQPTARETPPLPAIGGDPMATRPQATGDRSAAAAPSTRDAMPTFPQMMGYRPHALDPAAIAGANQRQIDAQIAAIHADSNLSDDQKAAAIEGTIAKAYGISPRKYSLRMGAGSEPAYVTDGESVWTEGDPSAPAPVRKMLEGAAAAKKQAQDEQDARDERKAQEADARAEKSSERAEGRAEAASKRADERQDKRQQAKAQQAYGVALQASNSLNLAKQYAANANAGRSPGTNDYALQMEFLRAAMAGMRGVRLTRAEIERSGKTRDLPGDLQVTFDHAASGALLTPEQRAGFVDLIQRTTDGAWGQARQLGTLYGYQPPAGVTPPLPRLTSTAGPQTSANHQVGDVVMVKGQKVKITVVNPDGTFQGTVVH